MTAPATAARARSRVGTTITRSFRVGQQLRVADASGGSGTDFQGYATVWDEPYELTDWFWGDTYAEVMRKGCFAKSLAENADVRLLLNHEGIPLARTKSGTLTVVEDDTGLLTHAPELDGTSPLVQEIRSAMDRGDLDEMSLAFRVIREKWSPDFGQVDVTEAELLDVSVVTYPANPAASAQLRSRLLPAGMTGRRAARALGVLRRAADGDPDAVAVAQQVGQALALEEDPGEVEDTDVATGDAPEPAAAGGTDAPAGDAPAERSYPVRLARSRLELTHR